MKRFIAQRTIYWLAGGLAIALLLALVFSLEWAGRQDEGVHVLNSGPQPTLSSPP